MLSKPAPYIGPTNTLGISWSIGFETGWGTYGLHLAVEASKRGIQVDSYFGCKAEVPSDVAEILRPIVERTRQVYVLAGMKQPYPVLHSLGGALQEAAIPAGIYGSPDIGVTFFETHALSPEDMEVSKRYPRMIAGSTWNADILKAHGIEGVRTVLQGIDRRVFFARPTPRPLPDNFIIFSGGKIEFRKGQDLVVAAFKIFHARHPEAILMTAWANAFWHENAGSLVGPSPVVPGAPTNYGGRLDVLGWLTGLGIPEEAVIDLGRQPNHRMGDHMRHCDVALFASRCEGGTNLVAMEAMACGIPVIVPRNSGHLDLMTVPDTVYSLDKQTPLDGFPAWNNSDVEEMVERLEEVYQDRQTAQRRAANTANMMTQWGWPNSIVKLLDVVAEVA